MLSSVGTFQNDSRESHSKISIITTCWGGGNDNWPERMWSGLSNLSNMHNSVHALSTDLHRLMAQIAWTDFCSSASHTGKSVIE